MTQNRSSQNTIAYKNKCLLLAHTAVSHLALEGCSQAQLGVGARHRFKFMRSPVSLLPGHSELVLLVVTWRCKRAHPISQACFRPLLASCTLTTCPNKSNGQGQSQGSGTRHSAPQEASSGVWMCSTTMGTWRLGPITKSSMNAIVTVVLGMRIYQERVEGLPSGPLMLSGEADI